MEYYKKQLLFDAFLEKWGDNFQEGIRRLRRLFDEPEILNQMPTFNPIKIELLSEYQLEWIGLLAQLDNPIDKRFFKEYWIPIEIDGFDYYMDISNDQFAFFGVDYFYNVTYNWYKRDFFGDLNYILVTKSDPASEISRLISENEIKMEQTIANLWKERDELGFLGEIETDELEASDFSFEKCKSSVELTQARRPKE